MLRTHNEDRNAKGNIEDADPTATTTNTHSNATHNADDDRHNNVADTIINMGHTSNGNPDITRMVVLVALITVMVIFVTPH